MIVKPDAISASRAPSTSPLKSCDTNRGQLITSNLAHVGLPTSRATLGVVTQIAAEFAGLLHQGLTWYDLEHLPVVLLVFHIAWFLTANDDDRSNQLVIGG